MMLKIQVVFLSALAAMGLSWGASPEGRAAYPEKPYSDAEIMEMAISSVEKAAPYARQLFRPSLTNAQGRVTPPFAVSFKLDEIRALSDWTTWAGFLAKENRIPKGFTRAELVAKCREGVNYATQSHVAIKRIQMATDLGKPYWGSDARNGKNLARRWQSALWAGQIGFAASFVWDVLTAEEKRDVHDMLAAELRDLILRKVPTGFVADTKCEENAWELYTFAAALGLFPDDPEATVWFRKMREYAINVNSHSADVKNRTVIDPWFDRTTVADLVRGPCVYDDWTMQNHGFFHPGYVGGGVGIPGDAILRLEMIQRELHGQVKWRTAASNHNIVPVFDEVLAWLMMPDGELVMPNGNDWALYVLDQCAPLTTMACMFKSPAAKFMESRSMRSVLARQTTTGDGTFLLRPENGPWRQGVSACRVIFTYLAHKYFPSDGVAAWTQADYYRAYPGARLWKSQGCVRYVGEGYLFAYAIARGQVKNVCGIFAPLDPAAAKTLVPMRQGAAGNFTGWYGVEGRNWDAKLVGEPSIETRKDGVTIRESLLMCGGALRDDCEIVADPKGVTVTERVTACAACKVYRQFPARVAVSRDVTGPQPPGFTNRVNIVSLTGGQPYWGRNLCERSIDYNWYSPACRTNVVALKAGETLPTSRVRFEPVSGHR